MLNDKHAEDLKSSGLTDETITKAGFQTINETNCEKVLGFPVNCWGLYIPYPKTANGTGAPFARVKPDKPFRNSEGRINKYLSPKNGLNRLYIPHLYSDEDLRNTNKTIIITEGEKKALKGAQDLPGFIVIGVGGVWNFKTKDKAIIDDFRRFNWKDRPVFICYDSDVITKPQVQDAERALAQQLYKMDAEISICRLTQEGGRKVGLDDYLISHSPETFCSEVLERALAWTPRGLLSLEDAENFTVKALPFEEDIVGSGILPSRGTAWISAYSKMGKSIFAMNLGIAIAAGHAFLTQFAIKKPSRVLYLNEEISERPMQTRLRMMMNSARQEGFIVRDNFKLINRSGIKIDTDDGIKSAARMIRQSKASVVFWDCLYRFHSKNENKTDEMGRVIDSFDWFTRTFGVAHVIIHHHGTPTANEQRTGFQLMRGSSTFQAMGDTYFTLTRHKVNEPGTRYQKLSFELRNAESPEDQIVSRNPETLWYEVINEDPGSGKITIPNVVFALKELGGCASRQDLLDKLKAEYETSERTAERTISDATRLKRITKRMDGKVVMYHCHD